MNNCSNCGKPISDQSSSESQTEFPSESAHHTEIEWCSCERPQPKLPPDTGSSDLSGGTPSTGK